MWKEATTVQFEILEFTWRELRKATVNTYEDVHWWHLQNAKASAKEFTVTFTFVYTAIGLVLLPLRA